MKAKILNSFPNINGRNKIGWHKSTDTKMVFFTMKTVDLLDNSSNWIIINLLNTLIPLLKWWWR